MCNSTVPFHEKRCNVCFQSLPLTSEYWYSHKGGRDGYKNRCIECYNAVRSGTLVLIKAVIPTNHKKCSKCKQVLSTKEFSHDKYHNDGFTSQCKNCQSASGGHVRKPFIPIVPAGMKYCQKHAQCINPQGSCLPATGEYFYRDKTQVDGFHAYCKVCNSARNKSYAIKNHSKLVDRGRDYRSKIKTRIAAKNKEWRTRNKSKILINNQRRKAHLNNLPDTFTHEQWSLALAYWNGCCAVCERPLFDLFETHKAAMDHWIPLASDNCPGTIATNIIPLCHGVDGCNNRKRDVVAIDWLTETFGARKAARINRKVEAYFQWIREQG